MNYPYILFMLCVAFFFQFGIRNRVGNAIPYLIYFNLKDFVDLRK
jgi:hypothetical protein